AVTASLKIYMNADKVDQSRKLINPPEGDKAVLTLTINCNYETSTSGTYDLFWYIQYPNEAPKYMLRRGSYDKGAVAEEYEERFNASLDKTAKTVPLTVQNVQLSDSAVYYCALSERFSYRFK
uniref:Ig-like domain-containing protein n=1 Tax=Paramormyrops kingsleyae TaxID=1676925 RepID=A0A3B3Q4R3_9TELE